MNIPLVDLKAQYYSIKNEIDAAIYNILESSSFILGNALSVFEANFAKYIGTKYCLGVSNGTIAIQLALSSLGIGSGDEVITDPNTFIATTEAISAVGGNIEFVDVDPETILMAPQKLSELLDRLKIQGKKRKRSYRYIFSVRCVTWKRSPRSPDLKV